MVHTSIEAHNRSLSERVRLNRAILKNPYWYLPIDDVGDESYQPVGRGVKGSNVCGSWVRLMGCRQKELHHGVHVGSVNCTGKVVLRHQHLWCHKSSCPVCFARGWAVREARSIEGRFIEADKRGFGKVEHISVSVPFEDFGWSESALRVKCRTALLARGVLGGCMIFHGFRIDRSRRVLVGGAHYHVLGYIEGGFDVCRDCVHELGDCRSCTSFKGREVREYEKDICIVKVLDERKTVFGTAWYQLNHSTVRTNVKRPHACTWFGVCSYRKLLVKVDKRKSLCPICGEDLVKLHYLGGRCIVKKRTSPDYVGSFIDDLVDIDGFPIWVESPSCSYGRYGSGSHEEK